MDLEEAEQPQPTKWALISVYYKDGAVELARGLLELGYGILSSGGTARAIREAGLAVTDVADFTGVPAILGHRVVTLHPKVHGGILAVRTDPAHQADMDEYNLVRIDLVVVNLYPFHEDPSIELIDVGGPTMVRGGGKNHEFVGVVVDPADYDVVLSELRENGELSHETRVRLAYKAFKTTRDYDAQIVAWMEQENPWLLEGETTQPSADEVSA